MWDTLLQGSEQSLRTEYPYNIDPADENKSAGAIRVGDWKYYKGTVENQTLILSLKFKASHCLHYCLNSSIF